MDNSGTPGFGQVILDYDYDPAGNLERIEDTFGGIQTYTYDNLNRVASIEQTGVNVADKRVQLDYDPASQLETVQRFNDLAIASEEGEDGAIAPPFLTSSYSFDAKGRLTELTHGSIASYTFTYDPVGRITAWTNPQGSGTFSYDDTDQLTSAEYDYQNDESYDYDLNGNRTNDGYNTIANNRLETDGIYNYDYDNEGNRIRRTAIASGEITEYTWDYRDRLTSVETSSREGVLLSQVEYTYDVFDNRLSKQADTNADGELDIFEGYIYDSDHIYIVLEPDQFTYELDSAPSNGMVAIAPDGSFTYTPNEDFSGEDSFTYTETGLDGDTETLTYTVDASTGEIVAGSLVPEEPLLELPVQRYFYGPGVDWVLAEEAIAYSEDGITTEVEWALTDHLNSVTFVLDSTGAVLNAIAYDSFGNVTSETNADVDFRFLYTGREFDPETGLYQYRARYYDAAIAQFLSEDPIGFEAGDVNLYRYVGNSPLVYVDPSGNISESIYSFSNWVEQNISQPFATSDAFGFAVDTTRSAIGALDRIADDSVNYYANLYVEGEQEGNFLKQGTGLVLGSFASLITRDNRAITLSIATAPLSGPAAAVIAAVGGSLQLGQAIGGQNFAGEDLTSGERTGLALGGAFEIALGGLEIPGAGKFAKEMFETSVSPVLSSFNRVIQQGADGVLRQGDRLSRAIGDFSPENLKKFKQEEIVAFGKIDEVSGILMLNSDTATFDVLVHEMSHVNFARSLGKWKTGKSLSNFEINLMEAIGYYNNVRKDISLGVAPQIALEEHSIGAYFAQPAIQALRSQSTSVLNSYNRVIDYYGRSFVENALRFGGKGLKHTKKLLP